MKIKLKVPAKPKAEFASMGVFDAELKPNSVIEVESRAFADYLISEYDLKETSASDNTSSAATANPLEAEYPANFPKRKVFIGLKMPFETARNLSREQLIAINGIAPKTADAVLAWQPAPVAPAAPAKPDENTDETSNEPNEGGQE